MAWVGTDILIACSSDGYCSIMSLKDENLIGQRLPNELVEDETLRDHYTAMDTVDLKRFESIVKN